jgi:hypothetical protein
MSVRRGVAIVCIASIAASAARQQVHKRGVDLHDQLRD